MQQILTAITQSLGRLLPPWGGKETIRTTDQLAAFLGGRAAYVAQTSLYGYLKTRMGTRYAEIFQDQAFQPSLIKARTESFFGCLEDLTIHAVALLRTRVDVPDRVAAMAADALFSKAATDAMDGAPTGLTEARTRFAERLAELDWEQAGDPKVTFRSSQRVLVAAAPVIDSYREADREIIENSIKFRWIDIRRQLGERLDAGAVGAAITTSP